MGALENGSSVLAPELQRFRYSKAPITSTAKGLFIGTRSPLTFCCWMTRIVADLSLATLVAVCGGSVLKVIHRC